MTMSSLLRVALPIIACVIFIVLGVGCAFVAHWLFKLFAMVFAFCTVVSILIIKEEAKYL